MKQVFSLRPDRGRSWWFKGGLWEIERSSSNTTHIQNVAPEDGTVIRDEEIWLCVNQDGSFNIDRDISHWEKFATRGRNVTDQAEVEPSGSDVYYPLLTEPDLYLSFASLGRQAWDSLGGRYLSEHRIENEEGDGFLPAALRKKIADFHHTFGPPYMLWEFTLDARRYTTSVHSMLRQAQLIDLMTDYQRVLTGEASTGRLKEMISAVRDSEQQEVDRIDAVDADKWRRFRKLFSEMSDRAPKELAEKYSHDYQPATNKFDDFDLRGDSGLMKAVERAILDESTKPQAIGGLVIDVDLMSPATAEISGGWEFTFRFTHLLNVIWYQAFQAIMRGVLLRRCPSDNCDRPGGLFVATRPNQTYCSRRCKNYHNVQAHRRRVRRTKNGDLLP